MNKNAIVERLQKLAELEAMISRASETLAIAKEALEKTPEYYIVQANLTELTALQNRAVECRNDLKSLVWQLSQIEHFVDRKPVVGVEIKQFETVSITDEKKAKAWASANMPNALTLKISELNKVIKGGLEVDWAKVESEYRVQLAIDLSGYLPKEE